jgi:hypothetical protein
VQLQAPMYEYIQAGSQNDVNNILAPALQYSLRCARTTLTWVRWRVTYPAGRACAPVHWPIVLVACKPRAADAARALLLGSSALKQELWRVLEGMLPEGGLDVVRRVVGTTRLYICGCVRAVQQC